MNAAADHHEVWELLPWYVNGTLAGEERRRVERHLEGCAACRAEAELCRQLAQAAGQPEDVAPAPHPAQLDRLVAAIVARPVEAELAGRPLPARRPWRVPGAGRRALRVAAAALVLVAAGVVGYLLAPRDRAGAPADAPAAYRTLSSPEAPLDSSSGARPAGPLLRVVFAPEATEQEIRRVLLAVRGTVVGGPSPLGVYTVRLPAAPADPEPLPVVLDHLRREPQVRFAEVVAGGEATGPAP